MYKLVYSMFEPVHPGQSRFVGSGCLVAIMLGICSMHLSMAASIDHGEQQGHHNPTRGYQEGEHSAPA